MEKTTKEEFLEAFPYFKDKAEGLAGELLSVSSLRSFPAGMLIYSEGDSCHGIAFLLSGEIRVFKSGATGREITLYEIAGGETCILNASCILSGMNYPANAVSTAEGKMLLVPAPDFRRLVSKHEEMRDFVFTLLSRRLSTVMELVEEVAFGRMDERLMDYLVEKSEDNELHATHQNIASDLGTSREVVSRLLKDFERKGLVELSRNWVRLKHAP